MVSFQQVRQFERDFNNLAMKSLSYGIILINFGILVLDNMLRNHTNRDMIIVFGY